MPKLIGSCILAQAGGPTAVVNASVLGLVKEALAQEEITDVFGAAYGLKGVISGQLYDMGAEDREELELLLHTPSAVLGSSRYKLEDPEKNDDDYRKILEVFQKRNVRYFFFCGGNDSMDACCKIDRYLKSVGYECRVIGVPKTIDNDLLLTDHCPGYGSAAKYVATSMMEIATDARVYGEGTITVVEIMGRNTGWLTAASALAAWQGCGPDLIYLPERPFSTEKFLSEVRAVFEKSGCALVAVAEGVRDRKGNYFSETARKANIRDPYGNVQMGGLAGYLASILRENIDARVRGIELSLLQRVAAHVASGTDIEEAYTLGRTAVRIAILGASGEMVTIKRVECDRYLAQFAFERLGKVANHERKMPQDWINEEGNGVTIDFINYALPLIGGDYAIPKENDLPRYAKLKKLPA